MGANEEIAKLDQVSAAHVRIEGELNEARTGLAELRGLLTEPDPGPSPVVLSVNEDLGTGRALLTWVTDAVVQRWRVGRDGTDSKGAGPWSTEVAGDVRSLRFGNLLPGVTYTFTLTSLDPPGEPASITLRTSGTTSPPAGTGQTAAEKFGWGLPHPISDTFDYEGRPDSAKWMLPGPDWRGHNGNGRRRAENVYVQGGMMILRGDANGDTGWVRQRMPTKYGRWQTVSRSRNTGAAGHTYHVLHLLWPTVEGWPVYGETDFVEYTNPDAQAAEAWLHYPHNKGIPVQQIHQEKPGVDMTKWHVFELEWTPQHLRGWIDGEEWYTVSGGANSARRNIQDMYPAGAYTAQLDAFDPSGLRPAVFEIDRVLFWPIT